jgi:light-regulated signal transduction histidine kinase (bacteriophytochrome)
VQNFTNLLAQEYGDVLGSDGQKYIHYATDAAGRMRALINDLLEYSRLSHQDSGVQEVDVSHKIEMACMQLSEVIKQRDAQITYDEMPFIRANPLRFSRLMQNLIGNAIKYTDPDKPIHVRIKCEKRDSDYLFSVKDNGIGIKKEYLNKIFVIFERLHGNHDYAGTGIGLAICKKIVDSMGGKIWADSKLGKGSTFYFTVPKTRGERLEND